MLCYEVGNRAGAGTVEIYKAPANGVDKQESVTKLTQHLDVWVHLGTESRSCDEAASADARRLPLVSEKSAKFSVISVLWLADQ